MTKKLYSKSQFAALAGVNPSNITRACKTAIKAALVGKQIDAAHPDAVAYLDRALNPPLPSNYGKGLDPLYEEAVAACQHAGRYSANFIKHDFSIGTARATRIFETMKVNGLVPDAPTAPSEPKPSKPRGNSVTKENKKRAGPPRFSVPLADIPPYRETEPEEDLVEIPENIYAFLDWTLRDIIEKFGTDARFSDFLSATQKIEAINEKRLKNAQTKGELISRVLVKNQVVDVFNSAHLRLLKDGAKSIAAGVVSKHSAGMEISEIEAFVSDILGSFIRPIKNKINKALKDES